LGLGAFYDLLYMINCCTYKQSCCNSCACAYEAGSLLGYEANQNCAGGFQAITEVLQLIGGAALAIQTVVLGASLFQKAKKQQRAPEQAERWDSSADKPSTSQQTTADPRIVSINPRGNV